MFPLSPGGSSAHSGLSFSSAKKCHLYRETAAKGEFRASCGYSHGLVFSHRESVLNQEERGLQYSSRGTVSKKVQGMGGASVLRGQEGGCVSSLAPSGLESTLTGVTVDILLKQQQQQTDVWKRQAVSQACAVCSSPTLVVLGS